MVQSNLNSKPTKPTLSREGILLFSKDDRIINIDERAKELLLIEDHLNIHSINLNSSFIFYNENQIITPFFSEKHIAEERILQLYCDQKEVKWLSVLYQNTEDPNEYIASIVDISKIILKQDSIVETNLYQQALVSSIDDLVLEVSRDGTFINYWTKCKDFLFYKPEEFISKRIEDFFPDNLSQTTLQKIKNVIETKENEEVLFRFPKESNDKKWFRAYIKPFTNSNTKVIIVVSDVTIEIENKMQAELRNEMFRQTFHY